MESRERLSYDVRVLFWGDGDALEYRLALALERVWGGPTAWVGHAFINHLERNHGKNTFVK